MSQLQTYLLICILAPIFLYFYTTNDHWLYWMMAFLICIGLISQIKNKSRSQRLFTIIGPGLIGLGCVVIGMGGNYNTGWIVILMGIMVCVWRDVVGYLWKYKMKNKN